MRVFSNFIFRIFSYLREDIPIEDRDIFYKKALDESKEICKYVYNKKIITDDDGYSKLYTELKPSLDNIKQKKLKKLTTWR